MTVIVAAGWRGPVSALIAFATGFLIVSVSQLMAGTIVAAMQVGASPSNDQVRRALGDGDALSLTFVIALPLLLAWLYPIVRYRRGQPVLQFLAITSVPWHSLGKWSLVMLALLAVYLATGTLMNRPEVPVWMLNVYATVDNVPLFLLSVAVLGPALEEVLYRGYMLTMFAGSRLGNVGAAILVSALWSLSHFQYDYFDVAWIFLFGLLLCACRLHTGSLLAPLVLHGTWNFISTIAVFLYLR